MSSEEPMAIEASCQRVGWQMRQAWLKHDVYCIWHRQMIHDTAIGMPDQIGSTDRVSLFSAAGPAFTHCSIAYPYSTPCQLNTTMPPGYHREPCCLPTEYPNSLTLRGLPQHKLNIKLGAHVMMLRSTCRPSVWPLQRHRLHRPS